MEREQNVNNARQIECTVRARRHLGPVYDCTITSDIGKDHSIAAGMTIRGDVIQRQGATFGKTTPPAFPIIDVPLAPGTACRVTPLAYGSNITCEKSRRG